ncbi:hypothetical protein [Botrimarina colliarenosi]|nr:hypothetical protein [Botrimarina colliarenosi]
MTCTSQATLSYNDDVTPGVIFGSGNANGGWTIDTNSSIGLELALRAKVRFPTPQNQFNLSSNNVYTFQSGAASGSSSWITSETPNWNFEYSINTDLTGSGGAKLDDYFYVLQLDFNPAGGAIAGPKFDPIRPLSHPLDGFTVDNSYGDNSTTSATDTVGDFATTPALAAANNVTQNSQSYEFWNNVSSFDPTVNGTYELSLTAFTSIGEIVGQTSIIVATVPEASPVLIGSLMTAGFGLVYRRRSESTEG